MRYVFIINPKAGKGRLALPLSDQIKEYFKDKRLDSRIFFTEYPGHAAVIAKEEAAKPGSVILFACGGDGTLFEVVNGAYGFQNASVGIFPIGSGNDFIKSIGNKNEFLNIDYQVKGSQIPVDLIKCGDKFSINVCSVGFDAQVAANMSKFKKLPFLPVKLSYFISIFYCFLKHINNRFALKLSGEENERKGKYLLTAMANAKYYGGGFKVAPDANLNDGLLDIVIIRSVTRMRILSLLGKFAKGTHVEETGIVSVRRDQKITITAEENLRVNMDGEVIDLDSNTAEFGSIPKAIKVNVPSVSAEKFKETDKLASKILNAKSSAVPVCDKNC